MTFEELIQPRTADEIRAEIYADLADAGIPTTSWKPGAVVRTIIAVVSNALASLSQLQAAIARGGFLDTAEGEWLRLLALYAYDVTKDEGSFATGTIVADNSGGGVYSGDPGDLVFLNASTGKTYRNTAAFSIGALETGVEIAVQAVELGSASTSPAGAVEAMETPLLGVTVTNPAAIVGNDAETDVQLRARCRAKLGTLSPNGPRDAYDFLARTTTRADGSSIGVKRTRAIPDGIGGVDLYLADDDSGIAGDPGDPDTDLGAIQAAIEELAEPLAVTARVHGATPVTIATTYELWIDDPGGRSDAEIEEVVEERLIEFFASQAIGGDVIPPAGGKIYVSAIEAAIGALFGDSLVRLTVTLPAADVDIDPTEVPVAGTVTATDIHVIGGSL